MPIRPSRNRGQNRRAKVFRIFGVFGMLNIVSHAEKVPGQATGLPQPVTLMIIDMMTAARIHST